jgi:streptogramin lyase
VAGERGPDAVFDAARGEGEVVASPPLSGDDPEYILEDLEGNVWIATQHGLDRLREQRVHRSPLSGAGCYFTLARDADGVVWAADRGNGALWRIAPGRAPQVERGRHATMVANDRRGALMLAATRGIEMRYRGAIERIPFPPGPDGKPAALRRLQEDHPGVAAGFEVGGNAARLAPALAEEVAEIAREAMRNAFHHAGATRIDVRLTYGRRRLALEVADDGGGIAEAVLQAGRRERASQIGGQLTVDSGAGGGAKVRLAVPLV